MIKVIKLKKIVFFVVLFGTIFGILYYKFFLFGNNIIKNRSDNIENIFSNMQNYCADVTVKVLSNKTENSYVMYQEVANDWSMQEIKEGEDVAGVKIELNGDNLKVSNSKLNLEKVYQNYSNLLNNSLFLNTFANDYQNEQNEIKCYDENEEKIIEIKLNSNQNTYIKYKKLYVDSKTMLPTKLEIKDNTKKETICIVYNNIELK